MRTIDFHMPILIVFYIIIFGVYSIFHKNKKNRLRFGLIELYVLVLIKVVIAPIVILDNQVKDMILANIPNKLGLQFVPFKTIIGNFSFGWGIIQNIGNILLLMPLALIVVHFSQNMKKQSRLIFVGFITSVMIELIQFLLNYLTQYPSHAVDIDDIILNGLGYMIAFVIVKKVVK